MALKESGEMYLETILILSKGSSFVRAIDISDYMHFSKPSVSRALSVLKNGGYIEVSHSGCITLTKEGLAEAERIYERHNVLTQMLIYLGVEKDQAIKDACKMEHDISLEAFEAIKKHIGHL